MPDDLTFDRWDRMAPKERVALARRLAGELPGGFTLRSVRLCRLGGQKHYVATYEFEGASFALIAGGKVTLGHDPDRPWEPTQEELESWQGTAEEYGIERTLREHVAAATLKPRTVRLRPFLMETTAGEVGWEPASPEDP